MRFQSSLLSLNKPVQVAYGASTANCRNLLKATRTAR